MINKGKIKILENIIIDVNLPKHKKEEDSGIISGGFNNGVSGLISGERESGLQYLEYLDSVAPTVITKFKIWIYKKLYFRTFQERDRKMKITPVDVKIFFDSIKGGVSELDKKYIDEILEKYNTVLANAVHNNQIALIEKINDYARILKNEIILSTSKFNKFLTEENIVKFHDVASVHEKHKTGLCLTYVKNFIKIIPEDITELKKEADTLKVFDNYVVLHYDYSGKAVQETKEEINKRKDPILFGVIQGSNRLYYIGDWIDDYCDLTLDVIIKKLGKKSVNSLNAKTIINNINKI